MYGTRSVLIVPLALLAISLSQSALALEPIAPGDFTVQLEPVATGLTSPMELIEAGDGSGRLFIADQDGRVHLLQNGALAPEPFLDVGDRLVGLRPSWDERGLLGMAFHPGFADPASPGYGRLYTYTSEPISGPADFSTTEPTSFDHQSVIAEWQVDPANPDQVDPGSRRVVMSIDQPQFTHNAGMLRFRESDGYLYIALGDGGDADDTGPGHSQGGNAQDLTNVHGSLLRIDPLAPSLTPDSTNPSSANGSYRVPADNPFMTNDEAVDEIFAYGLRNPWKFSFDAPTDRLIVGDVGQVEVEEVNLVSAGDNLGWPAKEGRFLFDQQAGMIVSDEPVEIDGMTDPVLEYANLTTSILDTGEGTSVIGGHVYRGSLLNELKGSYIFGDLSGERGAPAGRLFVGNLDDGTIEELLIEGQDHLELFLFGIGHDAAGELYVLGSTHIGPDGNAAGGRVYRIVPEPSSALLLALGAMVLAGRRRPPYHGARAFFQGRYVRAEPLTEQAIAQVKAQAAGAK